ncbi:hypothetical protein JXA88_11015 [Candidatus Fermentibacteria bacterium]|nr:hypothetical protein [Candidatus Fermentibacteria bacterium]
MVLLMVMTVASGLAEGESMQESPQDSSVLSDSTRVMNDVPAELLENIDLLLDLEMLEFVSQFGDTDIAGLLPEDAEPDSAPTMEN